MTVATLAEQITLDLDAMGIAIVRNDVEKIETSAARVSAMLCEMKQELVKRRRPASELTVILAGARRCSAILRRARVTLKVLQNLHELFSSESYHVSR